MIQAQQRITFTKVSDGHSSYTHIRYSDDGVSFTAASQEALSAIAPVPECVCSQLENGWEDGRYSITDGTKTAAEGYVRAKDLAAVEVGQTYQVRTHRAGVGLELATFNAARQFVRHAGAFAHGDTFVPAQGEAFVGVSANTALTAFRENSNMFIPALFIAPSLDGRNLLGGTAVAVQNSSYLIRAYPLIHKPIAGERLCVTIWGQLGEGKTHFAAFNSGGNGNLSTILSKVSDGVYQGIFPKWRSQAGTYQVETINVSIYVYPSAVGTVSRIDHIQLEYGDKSTVYKSHPVEAAVGTTVGRYMGVQVSESPVASPVFTDYTWQLVQGKDGTNGQDGTDGKDGKDGTNGTNGTSSYTHVRYSDDGASFTEADRGNSLLYATNASLAVSGSGRKTWRNASQAGTRQIVEITDAPFSGIFRALQVKTANTFSNIAQDGIPLSVGRYTLSCWARALEAGSKLGMYLHNGGTLSDASYVDGGGTIERRFALTTEWQRYTLTYDIATAGKANAYFGTGGAGTVQICGMMLEQGDAATAYIPEYPGTTAGAYLGVQVSDNPIASVVFGDYKWGKVLGENGRGITGQVDYFFASPRATGITADTAGFTATLVAPTAASPYLWSYTQTTYTDGATEKSTARIVSVYNAGVNPNLLPQSAFPAAPNAEEDGAAAYWTNAGSELGILAVNLGGLLLPDTWYTLSFLSRSATNADGAQANVSISITIPPATGAKDYQDGAEITPTTRHDTTWPGAWVPQRRALTFRTPQSLPDNPQLLLATYVGTTSQYGQVKLERGMQATGYLPNSTDLRGADGAVSPMLYPAGFWDASKTYGKTADAVPYVVYPNTGAGRKYALVADTSTGNPPTDAAYWKPLNELQETFVSALVAEFGKIGGAVFTGDKMISQRGLNNGGGESTDYQQYGTNFTPKLELDFATGKMICNDAEIGGKLKGVSGTFDYLGGAAKKAGIHFDDGGRMLFDGDGLGLSDGGHNSDGKFRFTNLYAMQSFAASRHSTLYIEDTKYFLYDPSKTLAEQTRHNLFDTILGQTIYPWGHHNNIPISKIYTGGVYFPLIGNPESKLSGYEGQIPLGLVVFKNTTTNPCIYVFDMPVGQTIRLFNANDDVSISFIASGGVVHELSGGAYCELLKLAPSYVSPAIPTGSSGSITETVAGVFVLNKQDNNW